MAKSNREKIRLVSSADTGHFYTTDKNKKTMPGKMEIKKLTERIQDLEASEKERENKLKEVNIQQNNREDKLMAQLEKTDKYFKTLEATIIAVMGQTVQSAVSKELARFQMSVQGA